MKDFLNCPNKRLAQAIMFSAVGMSEKVVGLGGINIDKYTEQLSKHGVKYLQSWETDSDIYNNQVALKKAGLLSLECEIKYGSIDKASMSGCRYHLDFCKSITSTANYVKKFKDAIFTFSLWNRETIEGNIAHFVELQEKGLTRLDDERHGPLRIWNIDAQEARYMAVTYWDYTSEGKKGCLMMTISKI